MFNDLVNPVEIKKLYKSGSIKEDIYYTSSKNTTSTYNNGDIENKNEFNSYIT